MLPKTKRNLFAFIFIVVFFTAGILCYHKDSFLFHHLTEKLFKEQLLKDTLSMHYTVARPENFHLSSYKPVLPVYSASAYNKEKEELSSYASRLSRIKTDSLSQTDSSDCRLLLSYLNDEKESDSFLYYREPLSPSQGAQSQLPILLAEYTFRTKKDITDYLALLDQTDDYFAGLTVYEQEKADAGMFMSEASADKVIAQCSVIMDKTSLQNKTHFLIATFEERLAPLLQSGIISASEKELFSSENDRLLSTVMLPAYEKLADELFLLKSSSNEAVGLCHYPKGKEYYTLLVRRESGSSKTIAQLKAMLLRRFSEDYTALASLVAENTVITQNNFSPPAAISNAETILTHLQKEMQADFPPLPETNAPPSYTVKEVSKSLEAYTSPAFYLTPPLDDIKSNTIYINKQSTPAGLSLYTTLAHEGYPGHLYQSVYYQLHSQNHDLNPIRSLLYYGGYQEGWAFYVETLSYDYACRLLADSPDKEALTLSYHLERLDRDMQLCLYSLLDIAIHYDGASYTQIHNILCKFGISDRTVTKQLYEYIVENPSNYLKYYVGYLEILNLKKEASSLWKDSYSDKLFHTFFLEAGPCDFDTLSEKLKNVKPGK